MVIINFGKCSAEFWIIFHPPEWTTFFLNHIYHWASIRNVFCLGEECHCPPIMWNHYTITHILPCMQGNPYQFQYKPPRKYTKTSHDSLTNFCSHFLFSCLIQLFPLECWFLHLNLGKCIAFMPITCSVNWDLRAKWQSRQPISDLWFLNSFYGCQVMGFLERRRRTQEYREVPSPKSYATSHITGNSFFQCPHSWWGWSGKLSRRLFGCPRLTSDHRHRSHTV